MMRVFAFTRTRVSPTPRQLLKKHRCNSDPSLRSGFQKKAEFLSVIPRHTLLAAPCRLPRFCSRLRLEHINQTETRMIKIAAVIALAVRCLLSNRRTAMVAALSQILVHARFWARRARSGWKIGTSGVRGFRALR